jgi:hypothetical protein
VVVVTIGARVVVVPVTIGATVVVVTAETAGTVVVVTADGATVVEVEAIVVVVVVVDSGALSEASSKNGLALTFVGATGGNLIVKSVCPFAHFVRILTANTLVRL